MVLVQNIRRWPCASLTGASRSLANGAARTRSRWLAARLAAFVDLHPDLDVPVDRLATWLARADDEDDEL